MTTQRLLFITNAELGQANVHLAVIEELLSTKPDLELHVCSFGSLAQSVASLTPSVSGDAAANTPNSVVFHELQGPTWKETLFHRPEHKWTEVCSLPPGCWSAKHAAPMMPRIVAPWTNEELSDLVLQVDKVVRETDAHLVIVDNLFTPAVTVCYALDVKWCVLTPNTYREFIIGKQPLTDQLLKHPPTASLIPYPIPFYLLPAAWWTVREYLKLAKDTWVVNHAIYMRDNIKTQYSDWGRLTYDPPEGLKIILPSNADVDFPFSVVPDHLVSCGPIVRPTRSVADADAELAAWLKRRPTVYINLGTHVLYDDATTLQLAGAVKSLLDAAKDKGQELQVLWKLNKGHALGEDKSQADWIRDSGYGGEDRIRIVEWLRPEPVSVLESGAVVCSVNHGGANSYFEAVNAGVPQVVLPVWFDTYDFARRVEYLGIGKIGNHRHAPRCDRTELARVLQQVVFGPESQVLKARAAKIAEACKASGGGRSVATRAILDLL